MMRFTNSGKIRLCICLIFIHLWLACSDADKEPEADVSVENVLTDSIAGSAGQEQGNLKEKNKDKTTVRKRSREALEMAMDDTGFRLEEFKGRLSTETQALAKLRKNSPQKQEKDREEIQKLESNIQEIQKGIDKQLKKLEMQRAEYELLNTAENK